MLLLLLLLLYLNQGLLGHISILTYLYLLGHNLYIAYFKKKFQRPVRLLRHDASQGRTSKTFLGVLTHLGSNFSIEYY